MTMPNKKTTVRKSDFIRELADFDIRNLREIRGMSDLAEGSPFAGKGYEPDEFIAYVTFDICHTLPGVWIGPVSSGDYIGFMGDTLAASHTRLRRKPFNYRHRIKAYAAPDEKAGKRDNIIGCIIDTHMDAKPFDKGFWSPSNPEGAETCIHCIAVVFKLAENVAEILGNHQASREKQGVSIEVWDTLDNLSVLRPSTNEMFPYLELPEDWHGALKAVPGRKRPRVGTLDGEQLIVVYGGGGAPVQFRGVGMTPDPAEKFFGTQDYAAMIDTVNAESDGREVLAVCAESVPQMLADIGARLRFDTGRVGKVRRVITEGIAGGCHRASKESPVLECALELCGTAYVPLKKAIGKFL